MTGSRSRQNSALRRKAVTRALSYIVTCFYFFEFIGEKTNFFDRFCQKSVYIIQNYRLFPAVIETEYSSGFVQICNGTLLSVGGGTGKKSLVFQEFCTFCTGFCTVCPVQRIIAYSAWLVYITTHQEFLRIVQYFPGAMYRRAPQPLPWKPPVLLSAQFAVQRTFFRREGRFSEKNFAKSEKNY